MFVLYLEVQYVIFSLSHIQHLHFIFSSSGKISRHFSAQATTVFRGQRYSCLSYFFLFLYSQRPLCSGDRDTRVFLLSFFSYLFRDHCAPGREILLSFFFLSFHICLETIVFQGQRYSCLSSFFLFLYSQRPLCSEDRDTLVFLLSFFSYLLRDHFVPDPELPFFLLS